MREYKVTCILRVEARNKEHLRSIFEKIISTVSPSPILDDLLSGAIIKYVGDTGNSETQEDSEVFEVVGERGEDDPQSKVQEERSESARPEDMLYGEAFTPGRITTTPDHQPIRVMDSTGSDEDLANIPHGGSGIGYSNYPIHHIGNTGGEATEENAGEIDDDISVLNKLRRMFRSKR